MKNKEGKKEEEKEERITHPGRPPGDRAGRGTDTVRREREREAEKKTHGAASHGSLRAGRRWWVWVSGVGLRCGSSCSPSLAPTVIFSGVRMIKSCRVNLSILGFRFESKNKF
jgi:hypothetical protein